MSSRSIAFTVDRPFELGTIMELAIGWPTLLHGKTALKLVVKGRVVRCDEKVAAITITRYEFRTQGALPA